MGLIGPNGAGKTTAFNVITGVYAPTAGSVQLLGASLTVRRHLRALAGVARTFQNIRLFGQLSVIDNVKIACHMREKAGFWRSVLALGSSRAEEQRQDEIARKMLALLGLEAFADQRSGSLPYGGPAAPRDRACARDRAARAAARRASGGDEQRGEDRADGDHPAHSR